MRVAGHDRTVDDARVGRSLRVLRQRRGLRQSDVAKSADVAQSLVSEIESGRLVGVRFGDLRRVFEAVGSGFDGDVIWRGAALDRLLDARHAAVVAASMALLRRLDWDVHPEVSYSIFGERGSIDVLAARENERAVVVEEAKAEIGNIGETIRKLDEKSRLVRERIGDERFGWSPAAVGRLLVLSDTDTARRAVARNAAVLEPAFPARGPLVRRWLRAPVGPMSGILFLPIARPAASAAARGARPGAPGGVPGARPDADIAGDDRRAAVVGVTRVRPPGTTAKRR